MFCVLKSFTELQCGANGSSGRTVDPPLRRRENASPVGGATGVRYLTALAETVLART